MRTNFWSPIIDNEVCIDLYTFIKNNQRPESVFKRYKRILSVPFLILKTRLIPKLIIKIYKSLDTAYRKYLYYLIYNEEIGLIWKEEYNITKNEKSKRNK